MGAVTQQHMVSEALGRHPEVKATNLEEIINTEIYTAILKSNDEHIGRLVGTLTWCLEDYV